MSKSQEPIHTVRKRNQKHKNQRNVKTKKIFAVAYAFIQCEWALNVYLRLKTKSSIYCLVVLCIRKRSFTVYFRQCCVHCNQGRTWDYAKVHNVKSTTALQLNHSSHTLHELCCPWFPLTTRKEMQKNFLVVNRCSSCEQTLTLLSMFLCKKSVRCNQTRCKRDPVYMDHGRITITVSANLRHTIRFGLHIHFFTSDFCVLPNYHRYSSL